MDNLEQFQKKTEELTALQYADKFNEEMQKSLDEQKQRFEEAKRAKQKNKELSKRNIIQTTGEKGEALQATETDFDWILVDKREEVGRKMPPKLPAEIRDTALSKQEELSPLPDEMMELIDEVASWKKVKDETSLPVKEAAKELKKAKSETERAEAMSVLALACTSYIEQNGSKIFKSSRRKKAIRNLLGSIADYMVSSDTVYYDFFVQAVENADYQMAKEYAGQVDNKIKESEGVKDIKTALDQKRMVEMDRTHREEFSNKEARDAFKKREEYRFNVPAEYAKKEGLKLKTDEDRQAEYEDYKQKNSEINEEAYEIFEKHQNAAQYVLHPEYRAMYERGKRNYLMGKDGSGDYYSREALTILRSVNFDENFKPISEEDKANHEWNLKFLRAYELDDVETQEKLIAEEYPHFLDNVEFPNQLTKEDLLDYKNEKNAAKAEEKKKILMSRLNDWVMDYVKNGDANAFVQQFTRSYNFDTLKKMHPNVLKYKDANKVFDAKFEAFSFLGSYVDSLMDYKYNMTLGLHPSITDTSKWDARYKKKAKDAAEFSMEACFEQVCEQMLNLYDKLGDDAPEVPYEIDQKLIDESMQRGNKPLRARAKQREELRLHMPEEYAKKERLNMPTDADRQAEYENLKKEYPYLTKEAYQVYERFNALTMVLDNPEYRAIYNRSKKNYRNVGAQEFSREATGLLKTVKFDKNFKPISEEDKARHEWNLKVLRAFDEDNIEEREKMIKEFLPHVMDDMELPTSITEEDILNYKNEKNAEEAGKKRALLKDRFNSWLKDYMKNGDVQDFTNMSLRTLSVNQLERIHPGVKEYRSKDKKLESKWNVFDTLTNYISYFARIEYRINIEADVKVLEQAKKDPKELKSFDRGTGQQLDAMFDLMLDQMLDMFAHENDNEVVEYETAESTKEEIRRQYMNKPVEEANVRRDELNALRQARKEENIRKQKEREQAKQEAAQETTEETVTEEKTEEKKKYKLNARQLKAKTRVKRKVRARVESENSKLFDKSMKENDTTLTEGVNVFQKTQIRDNYSQKLADNISIGKESKINSARFSQFDYKYSEDSLYVEDHEETTVLTPVEKKRNAQRMTHSVDSVTDMRARMRLDVPMDIKKKVDYRTFMDLSEVAGMYGKQAELEKLINLTAESDRQLKAVDSRADSDPEKERIKKQAGYPLLDHMTSQLLKIDASSFDIRSDEAIVKNAVELERMAKGVEAYRKMVERFGGEDYYKYLSEKKIEGVTGDMGQMAISQLHTLTNIARYYRTRKLIMEDEEYIESNGEILLEDNEQDSFEVKRLKELMRKSNELVGHLDDCFHEGYFDPGPYLKTLKDDEKDLTRLEHERYFVAPKWLQNSLQIGVVKDHNDDDNPGFAITQDKGHDYFYKGYHWLDEKNRGHLDAYNKVRANTKNRTFASSGEFKTREQAIKGKKGDSLTDNMDRLSTQLEGSLAYRRTPAETEEMLQGLAIQKMKDWETNAQDNEAYDFCRSYHAEMMMQHIESVYAAAKRVTNSIGSQILIMHPADLAMQVTGKLKAELMGATVATNIEQNRGTIENLFKENNKDGRYIFNGQDFSDIGAITGNSVWKCCNNANYIRDLAQDKLDIEDADLGTKMTLDELATEVFGMPMEQIKKEGEEIKAREIKELEKQAGFDPLASEKLKDYKMTEPSMFFLSAHKEAFTMKNFLLKTPEGKYFAGEQFMANGRSVYSNQNVEGLKNCLDKGLIKEIPEEVLKNYEQSLKDRKMPAYMIEGDPYGINLYRTHADELVVKDDQGKPVYENGKLKVKNILKFKDIDPDTGKAIKEG